MHTSNVEIQFDRNTKWLYSASLKECSQLSYFIGWRMNTDGTRAPCSAVQPLISIKTG